MPGTTDKLTAAQARERLAAAAETGVEAALKLFEVDTAAHVRDDGAVVLSDQHGVRLIIERADMQKLVGAWLRGGHARHIDLTVDRTEGDD